jgi:S-adenosylmethionine:tRNA ribosyltransferase-isomerase
VITCLANPRQRCDDKIESWLIHAKPIIQNFARSGNFFVFRGAHAPSRALPRMTRALALFAIKSNQSMNTRLSDYDYDLPGELIAQRPPECREGSRMMVLRRDRQTIEHRDFAELKTLLEPGDLLVLNDTRVLPARRFSSDGTIEFLFIDRIESRRWRCLVKPGRKMRVGATAKIENATLRVEKITPDGERIVTLDEDIDLYAGGSMPLPPYIGREGDEEDETRYQTVFAHVPGALAAPTAGLHFTPEILDEIPHTFITLHVGTGTFLPVRSEEIAEHRMHAEHFSISAEAANKINNARRIGAVGTTTVRMLESARRTAGKILAQEGLTDIFIYPPYRFQGVDLLLTNFHLPRSTLLVLVSAFAGREFLLRAYQEAIRERYRFYSYGDCMLIL